MPGGAELGVGYVSLTVEAEGIEDEVRKKIGAPLEQETDKATKRAGGSFGGLALVAGGALAGVGVASLVGDLNTLGTTVDVTGKKAATVFEGGLGTVQQWADANAKAFGSTDSELEGLAAGFGDLLKPMGFTGEQAATMSTDVVGLAGALSAWSGGQYSAKDASDILAAAMLGETDSLKGLGIAISQADIEARLAAKGQSELTGAALEQAKAVATQELIFEKSADAQKAWSDGSFDAVKQQNSMKSTAAELRETIATGLFPAFQAVTGFLVNTAIPAFGSLVGFIRDNKEPFIAAAVVIGGVLVAAFVNWAIAAGTAAVATLTAMGPVLLIGAAVAALAAGVIWAYQNVGWFREAVQAVGSFLADTLWPILQRIGEVIGVIITRYISIAIDAIQIYIGVWRAVITAVIDVAQWVGSKISDMIGFITAIPGHVSGALSSVFNPLKDAAEAGWRYVSEKVNAVVDYVRGIPGRVGNVFGGMFDGITGAMRSAVNAVAGLWNRTVGRLSFQIPGWVPGIGGNGFDVPDIPYLARGGLAFGATAAVVGEVATPGNPEVIAPLRDLRAMLEIPDRAPAGDTVVHVATQADPHAIARAVAFRRKVAGR